MVGLRFPALFTSSAVFLASAALSAAAEPSVSILKIPDVPCTGSWTGPSADNSFDCGGGQITDFVKDPSVWSIAVPFALGFLCLVPISCIILCGRYCCNCCGSAKVRPNSFCGGKCCGEDPDDTLTEAERVAAYSQASINFVNILCLFTFGLGVAGIVLSYFGCATLASAVLDITPTVFSVADWALDLVTQIKAAVADPNDPNSYPDGFDMSMFDDVATTLTDVRGDLEDGVKPFAPAVALGVRIFGFVSIVPGLVLFTPAVCAFFKVRQILPLILIVVSFALQFLYYFFSTFCLLMVILFGMLHKEMNAANEPHPEQHKSVMQWYLIPMCDKEAPFESALDNLNEMEYDASVSACNKLLDFCTPSNAPWNPFGPNPEKVFYCNINDANTDCANVSLLSDVIGGMYVLDGVPPSEACGTAVDNNTMCTFEECASSCVNSDTRSSADEAMTNLRTAERIVNALDDILKPWLSCSALIKKVLSLGFTKTMKTVEKGSSTLAAGSLCIGSGLLLAIITAFLGQKRFIDRSWAVKELEGYDARENGDEMRSTKPMYDSGFNQQQQLQQSQKQEQEGIPMAVFAAPTQVSPKASPLYVPDGGHPQQFEDQHFTAPLENPSADAAGHPNAI